MSSFKKLKSLAFLCYIVFSFFAVAANAQRVNQIQNGVLINQQGQVLSNNGFGRINIDQVANPTINVTVPNSGRNSVTQIQNGVLISQQSQVMTNNFANVGNINIGGTSYGYQNFNFNYFAYLNYFIILQKPTYSHFDSNAYVCPYQSSNHAYNDGYHYGQGSSYDAAYDCVEYIVDYCEDGYYTPTPQPHPQPEPLICRDGEYRAYFRGQWICRADLVCGTNETRTFRNGRWICVANETCECPTPTPCPTGTVEDTTRRVFERVTCESGSSIRCAVRQCRPTTNPDPTPTPRVCTTDVRQCADGSFVSRDPNNNCEFRPCPVIPLPDTRPIPLSLSRVPVAPTLAIARNINLNDIQTQNTNQNRNQVQAAASANARAGRI
ncbi:MAG: hypothetical protein SFU25_00210 [Candidatus Caenarcaniphilales bacterium]|nr:hypothetical protein [Candidatus Caenarcaniphilales bacterium]